MGRRLVLIRHCQAEGQGPGAPLTAQGRADAAVLAQALASLGVDAVYASPFQRARATIAPFAALRRLTVMIDDRLAERRLEGEPSGDWMTRMRRSFEDADYRAPGGESLAEAQQRGLQALAVIAGQGHACPAAVTHGNLLSSILRSMDSSFGLEDWRALGNPDIYEIDVNGGVPAGYRRLERVPV